MRIPTPTIKRHSRFAKRPLKPYGRSTQKNLDQKTKGRSSSDSSGCEVSVNGNDDVFASVVLYASSLVHPVFMFSFL